MRGESDLEERSGLPLFWVTLAGGRRVGWLRYGPLLLFLVLLPFLFNTFFGPGHDPDGPASGLRDTALLVIGLNGWMLLIGLIYRRASRSRRFVRSHLIAWGVSAALALLVYGGALLLDALFSPSGHFFAVQGFFVVLLTLLASPAVLSYLLAEPPGFLWQRWRAHEGEWEEIEGPLRSVVDSYPRTLRPALLLLESLLVQGKRDEARRLLKLLVARHPESWGVWAAVGCLALEEEHWDRALAALKRADRLAPRAAQGGIRLNLGLALLGVGDLEAGTLEIDEAGRRLLPPHARQFRRFMLMRIGQLQQKPGLMLRASNEARQYPKDSFAFLAWYETLDRSRSPTLAEDLYEAADWTRHLLGIRQTR
jgi:hypothetical protein